MTQPYGEVRPRGSVGGGGGGAGAGCGVCCSVAWSGATTGFFASAFECGFFGIGSVCGHALVGRPPTPRLTRTASNRQRVIPNRLRCREFLRAILQLLAWCSDPVSCGGPRRLLVGVYCNWALGYKQKTNSRLIYGADKIIAGNVCFLYYLADFRRRSSR